MSYVCCTTSKHSVMLFSILLFIKFLFVPAPKAEAVPQSIYDFKVESLTGGTIDFSAFKGKKILIVNTASQCGNTFQYGELEKISKKYKDKLVIVGFPANDFGHQEPGNNQEIAEFCTKNYSVTFPMAAKISVKGNDMAPIYHWLTEKKYNGYKDSEVTWNFQKYLIDEHGKLVGIFEPGMSPMRSFVIDAIEK